MASHFFKVTNRSSRRLRPSERVALSIWRAKEHEAVLTGLLAEVMQAHREVAVSLVRAAGYRAKPKGLKPLVDQQVPLPRNKRGAPASGNRRPDIVFILDRAAFLIEAKATTKHAKDQAKSYVAPLARRLRAARADESDGLHELASKWDGGNVQPICLATEGHDDDPHLATWTQHVLAPLLQIPARQRSDAAHALIAVMYDQSAGARIGTLRPSLIRARARSYLWFVKCQLAAADEREGGKFLRAPDRFDARVLDLRRRSWREVWNFRNKAWNSKQSDIDWYEGPNDDVRYYGSELWWKPERRTPWATLEVGLDVGSRAASDARWGWSVRRSLLRGLPDAGRVDPRVRRMIEDGKGEPIELGASGPRLRLDEDGAKYVYLESETIGALFFAPPAKAGESFPLLEKRITDALLRVSNPDGRGIIGEFWQLVIAAINATPAAKRRTRKQRPSP